MRLRSRTRSMASMLALVLSGAMIALAPAPARGQDAPGAWEALLRDVVPGADRFDERQGEPPVFRAYRGEADGRETLVGYAFLTSDAPPEPLGFNGPIEVLVGMDLGGTLTGVRVTRYAESLRRSRGDFLARPGFREQFAGKSVADAFQVKRDVDGITGATISVDAMARGIRGAARRVALAHGLGTLSAAAEAPPLDAATVTAEALEPLSWSEMVLRGLVQQIVVVEDAGTAAELSLLPLRDDAVAELLIGAERLREVRERAGPLAADRHLVLAGVDGPLGGGLNLARLAVVQSGDTVRLAGEEVLLFGPPREGKLDGQVRFLRVLLLDRAVDLARPFTYTLDLRPGLGVYTAEYPGPRVALAAPPRPAGPLAISFEAEVEETLLARTFTTTSWPRVLALALLLALVCAAFATKRVGLRSAALAATLLYLGVIDKGFLSVSHVTSVLDVGPAVLLSDLPLLMLVTFTVVTTLLWGRVFCGYLCPFGALQDLLERIVPRRLRREPSPALHRRAARLKYGVLAVVLAPAVVGSGASLFQYAEPFGTVFFPSRSLLLWAIAAAILAASAVVPRFYCRYFCPLGAALALGALLSPLRIRRVEQCGVCKVCEQRCPTRAIRGAAIDFEECVRCNVCEVNLIRKAGVCRHDMAVVRSRLVRLKVVS
jgi:NosR/NirI family transcriptional regulator, nitrous oxide reductase regulator